MTRETTPALSHYLAASEAAARQIIRAYSTSFGIATNILGRQHRKHVRNIYALVRVADELVDGVTAEANLSHERQVASLNALEAETGQAVQTGYSSNPIVQAFASTARASGIDDSLIGPFFASMRIDQQAAQGIANFDEDLHADYVFGSAEVVGLMCLRVFTRHENLTPSESATLERGAKSLGAAFQNVNFLRDLADDTQRLERNYLSDGAKFDESLKNEWISKIRTQLTDAESVIPLLPVDARTGVDCARRLFARLTDKIAATPAERLFQERIRVSNFNKILILLQAFVSTRFFGRRGKKL